MSLVEHARRELELCGLYREDPAYAQSVISAVGAFAAYDHSGGSVGLAIEHITRLLRFETLSRLTSDPQEWMHVGHQDGAKLYQSIRNPQAFSTDGGKMYYILDEVDEARRKAADAVERPMHTAGPRAAYAAGGPVPAGSGQATENRSGVLYRHLDVQEAFAAASPVEAAPAYHEHHAGRSCPAQCSWQGEGTVAA